MGLRVAAPTREVHRTVAEHVAERVAHLARGAEDVLVIAVVEATTARVHHDVEVARDTRDERAQAVAHRAAVIGLDDQVDVVVLHREVNDAEVLAPECALEGRANRPEAALAAEVPRAARDANGDVVRTMP